MIGRFVPLLRATGPAFGLMLITAASCSPDRPLRPGDSPPAIVLSEDEITALDAILEDVRMRILPGLGNATATGELGATLEALAGGINTGARDSVDVRVLGVQRAIERTHGPITAAQADAPDVEAIRLAVLAVAALSAAPRPMTEQH